MGFTLFELFLLRATNVRFGKKREGWDRFGMIMAEKANNSLQMVRVGCHIIQFEAVTVKYHGAFGIACD